MNLKGTKTEKNLNEAFAGESMARNKYTYYASKAKKDGYVQISNIFEQTANNEKEHAKLWFKDVYKRQMASFIISIPMNKIPRPAKISPKALTFLPLRNVTSTTPKIATSGAILDASRAISCPVIVVPILAPMMIQTA